MDRSDDILERLAAVEAAVGGMAREPDDKRLTKSEVAKRYGVSPRTIERWAASAELKFPQPTAINNRWFFVLGDLRAWDKKRARMPLQRRAAPSRPRRRRKPEASATP